MAETFAWTDLIAGWQESGKLYWEFLRQTSLSAGIYRLGPDRPDPQQPHTEDEIYYVVEGQGTIEIGGERRPIGPGSVIFVEKQAVHQFVDYSAGLTLLVIFAPPRGSGRANQ